MECSYFEKMILDYIDSRLDKEMMEICSHHLSNCTECRNLNENYKSVRNEMQRVENESPPDHVLDSIRDHAREQGIIKTTPFYRKGWFYAIMALSCLAAFTAAGFFFSTWSKLFLFIN